MATSNTARGDTVKIPVMDGTTNDLISRQKLKEDMYHEAFEKDSDMQRWDSGCWIRYKLFEKAVDDQPSVQHEITEDDVKEWAHKRGLAIIDGALYAEMKRRCAGCCYEPVEGV